MDDQVVLIGGKSIHINYVICNVVWTVLLLAMMPLVYVGFKRAYDHYSISKSSPDMAAGTGPFVHWVHILAVYIICLLIAVDPFHAFIDGWVYVTLWGLTEISTIMISSTIYYYISHVESYATHRHVRAQKPEHIWKVRNGVLVANFAISNILNAVSLGLERPYYMSLGFLFHGIELVVLSPLMLLISVKLAREVKPGIEKAELESTAETANDLREGFRRFQRLSRASAALCLLVGGVLVFYAATFFLFDPNLTFSTVDTIDPLTAVYASNRRLQSEFRMLYVVWFPLVLLPYWMWSHKVWASKVTTTSNQKMLSPYLRQSTMTINNLNSL